MKYALTIDWKGVGTTFEVEGTERIGDLAKRACHAFALNPTPPTKVWPTLSHKEAVLEASQTVGEAGVQDGAVLHLSFDF